MIVNYRFCPICLGKTPHDIITDLNAWENEVKIWHCLTCHEWEDLVIEVEKNKHSESDGKNT